MGVILHNVVGLLHGAMGIYYAHVDRVPVMIFGGSGPATTTPAPNIDWIHAANVRATPCGTSPSGITSPVDARRAGDHPRGVTGARSSEPRGPVYIALDAGLQEKPLDEPIHARTGTARGAVRLGPDPAALRVLAERFARPAAGYHRRLRGPRPGCVRPAGPARGDRGAGVYRHQRIRLNFPNRHPLCVSRDRACFDEADLVLILDIRDMGEADPPHRARPGARSAALSRRTASCSRSVSVTSALSKWSEDYTAHGRNRSLRVTRRHRGRIADAARQLCAARAIRSAGQRDKIRGARGDVKARNEGLFSKWERRVGSPTGTPRRSLCRGSPREVGASIQSEDWVLTAGTLQDWVLKRVGFRQALPQPGARSAPVPRSASRSASRWPTAVPGAWWWTCSPTGI